MAGPKVRGVTTLRKKRLSYAIIREIYENDNASQCFENELEKAFEKEDQFIMIEPTKLGDEIALWIRTCNSLHKTAVISGAASLMLSGTTLQNYPTHELFISLPLAFIGWVTTSVYTLSCQHDPCVKYQVLTDKKRLSMIPPEAVQHLSTVSPVVLERRNDAARKMLHCSISIATAAYWGYKLYRFLSKP